MDAGFATQLMLPAAQKFGLLVWGGYWEAVSCDTEKLADESEQVTTTIPHCPRTGVELVRD